MKSAIFLYFILISLSAVALCLYDKHAAVTNAKGSRKLRRTAEKTLFTVAALGGSVAMLITMLLIRHKTRHKRFMIGLPSIIFIQLCLCILVKLLLQRS